MGFLSTRIKPQCYGCYACKQICPKSAIIMIADNEGFEYPSIDESKCISCGLCKKVCIAENEQVKILPTKALALVQNDDVLSKSSSGGAFYTIVENCDENTIFYGVDWDNRSSAKHLRASKAEAFDRFRKSKYVQSVIGDSYNDVKNDLKNGLSVVFVGTPCQVAGLKCFLNKNYDNLLTIDLICHGVPSSKMLESYFLDIEKKNNPVKSIEFRIKKIVDGKWNSKFAILTYDNDSKEYIEYDTSAFLRGYDNGLFFRPSCSTCEFACRERISDITIGDFWGGADENTYDVHKGTSLVMLNTEKGKAFFDGVNCEKIDVVNYEEVASHNARLNKPDKGHPKRDEFFERLEKESFSNLIQEYAPRVPKWKKFGHKILTKIRG